MAAGLLASGCDYWRNLVDDKSITRQRLDIKVFDVWTLKPLADAECRDKERGAYPRTPDNGLITVPEAETGHYEITCTHSQYLEFRSTFKLSSQGVQAEIAMARKGGKDWYPDDHDRQVQIEYPVGGFWTDIRYPSSFQIPSLPKDSANQFRYIWMFSQSPALNRYGDSELRASHIYNLDADIDEVKTGRDTLTLIVMSRLNGKGSGGEYEVGRVSKVFDWVRNRPPVFDTISDMSEQRFKVGCPGSTENRVFRFFFFAKDPDGGRCMGVRVSTRDTNTSLGTVNTFFNDCNRRTVILPLKSTFYAPSAVSIESTMSVLYLTAFDDNGDSTVEELKIRTYSNYIPKVTASISGAPTVVYVRDEVKLDYLATDEDGPIMRIITNWGKADAENEHFVFNNPMEILGPVEGTDTHIYSTPSPPERPYDVTVSVQDRCGVIETKVIGQLDVRENTPPKITLYLVKREIREGSLSLRIGFTLEDKEVFQDLDKYSLVVVDWGDELKDTLSTGIRKTFDTTLTHLYTTPPRNLEGYTVEIMAKDSHFRGTSYLDTLIAPP